MKLQDPSMHGLCTKKCDEGTTTRNQYAHSTSWKLGTLLAKGSLSFQVLVKYSLIFNLDITLSKEILSMKTNIYHLCTPLVVG